LVRISAEKELILRRFSKHHVPMRQTVGGGMQVDTDVLGKKMGYSGRQIEKIMEMGLRHSSLDEPLGEGDGASIMDVIEDTHTESPDAFTESSSRNGFVKDMLEKIPQQEREVLSLYFGIGHHQALNLEEIGEVIGLSKERVRQIKEKGLASLRALQEATELAVA
jgi:RNA polymerase primary sigma factor